ncbi:doublesex- and mab-3-related transcription factor A2-like [Branchiostoma floridae]|uniref:Doublesex- and mab-3-related transcription factor A2-like n=2 Tax=Branchiostoma floridae TaxID=7739 RepID=A0A9J7HPH7_BRAFL|nr:doublesex- and mab-3-related transcription factor A2-like [Branchiostoma floridae]
MSGPEKREYTCKRCRVHGVIVAVKGHKRQCPWKHCQCPGCQQVTLYRQEHASEINARRGGSDISAADVINIANVGRSSGATKATSTSAKRREKQVVRGIRNQKFYEDLNTKMANYASHAPGQPPLAHIRKAIVENWAETSGKKRSRSTYTYADTCMYKGYNPRREEAVAGPSSESAPFQESDSESESRQMPPPSSSDQAELDLDSDVSILADMFPGARENLGLAVLRDIRNATPNMEQAVDQLIAILDVPTGSSPPGATATRTTPPRLAKLAVMFPKVDSDVLKAVVNRAKDTPTAIGKVLALYSPPDASQQIGPTPRAEPPRAKRRRALYFSNHLSPGPDAGPVAGGSVQYTPRNHPPQKFKSPDEGPVASSSVQCTPRNLQPQKFKSPGAGPVAGSSVLYTPGNCTPQKQSYQLLNFNKGVDVAEQGAAQAEHESGGGRYTIQGADRRTPVKKRVVGCKICWAPVDRSHKYCPACGNMLSNTDERF